MIPQDLSQKIPGAPNFTWKEALWFPQWNRAATEADGVDETVLKNLETIFQALQKLRDHFGKPIKVHVAYRSPEYNVLIGGAKKSSHTEGKAIDFSIKGLDCDDVRKEILQNNFLESLKLRMEDLPGSNWVHVDCRTPGPSGRYFKP